MSTNNESPAAAVYPASARNPADFSANASSVTLGSHIDAPARPAMDNLSQYTQKKRPWLRYPTNFEDIYNATYEGKGTAESPYIVEWLSNDPENPQTYGDAYKWLVTVVVAVATLAVALASSAYSGAAASVIRTFGVSQEVFILGVSLFVLGFAFGPLFWAPAGEVYGRRNVFIFSYTFFTIWNAAAAGSNNMASLLVFRFLAGVFGSSPLANAGGTISDMFTAKQRGLALAVFAAMPFLGPSLGPISGGFIGDAGGFRWVQGFLGIFTAVLTILGFLLTPETYAPVLLRRRAALLSKLTGLDYRSPMDAKGHLDVKVLMKTSLTRPWKLLFLEPVVLIISIYMAIVYGTLYMLFSAFPIVFQRGRGWNAGVGGLAFLGVLVGMLLGIAWVIVYDNPRYVRVTDAHGGRAPAEARLPPALIGSVLLCIGLGWFTATCGPSVHYIVPIIAGAPFGAGMVLVFLSLMNYLIDCYVIYAASVLAANSVLRSLFGAIFPLFTTYMYEGLGVHWASAIPTFLAIACLPFPFLFYKYGHIIRERSKYIKEADAVVTQMMDRAKAAATKSAKVEV